MRLISRIIRVKPFRSNLDGDLGLVLEGMMIGWVILHTRPRVT